LRATTPICRNKDFTAYTTALADIIVVFTGNTVKRLISIVAARGVA